MIAYLLTIFFILKNSVSKKVYYAWKYNDRGIHLYMSTKQINLKSKDSIFFFTNSDFIGTNFHPRVHHEHMSRNRNSFIEFETEEVHLLVPLWKIIFNMVKNICSNRNRYNSINKTKFPEKLQYMYLLRGMWWHRNEYPSCVWFILVVWSISKGTFLQLEILYILGQ